MSVIHLQADDSTRTVLVPVSREYARDKLLFDAGCGGPMRAHVHVQTVFSPIAVMPSLPLQNSSAPAHFCGGLSQPHMAPLPSSLLC